MNYDDIKNQYGSTQRGIGVTHREKVAPEDEMFHSVYVGGVDRKNEMGITEEAGKFHIRGVEYNLNEVYCVITTSKLINAKFVKHNGRDKLVCFSYRESEPPVNYYGKQCPSSEERSKVPECEGCKSQILMVGILTDERGKPKVDKNKKPIFIFIRGKGVKYANVSDYLYSLSEMDIEPFFPEQNEESLTFEKNNVNPMRVVTRITKGVADSVHGPKTVFVFDKGVNTSKVLVERLLKLNTEVIEEFDKKFNWGLGLKKKRSTPTPENTPTSNDTTFEDPEQQAATQPSNDNVFGDDGENNSSGFDFDDDIPF